MKNIIIDLEMNISQPSEIIEIGAVKLDASNNIVERFKTYVKPNKTITNGTTKLTQITQKDVEEAPTLKEALSEFLSWLEINEEPFKIYSWSLTDLSQIKNECFMKEITDLPLDILVDNWYDLQREFGDLIHYEGKLSLHNALNSVNYQIEGPEHTALTDAQNTAYIYKLMHDPNSKQKLAPIMELLIPSKSFTLGDCFPQLKNLNLK